MHTRLTLTYAVPSQREAIEAGFGIGPLLPVVLAL